MVAFQTIPLLETQRLYYRLAAAKAANAVYTFEVNACTKIENINVYILSLITHDNKMHCIKYIAKSNQNHSG